MGKNKDKIRIHCCGESSHAVTGSTYWIEAGNKNYLIECGLYQSVKSIWENYKINTTKFPFKAKSIDAIFIGHIHIDHTGQLPIMYAHGCHAPIYIPKGNYEILKVLLEDCAFINARDAESISKQRDKEYPPLYTLDDVETCLSYVQEIDMKQNFSVDNQTTLQFVGSGHILNAAQVLLKINIGNITKTVAYTSDLGNIVVKTPYTSNFEQLQHADVAFCECTYANNPIGSTQKTRNKDLEKIKAVIIDTCIYKNAKVLIPCFANSRMQVIITELYDLFGSDSSFTYKVLVDSPMACKICRLYADLLDGEELEHYKDVLSWKNLVFIENSEDSRTWRDSNEPCIVCSSSGMLTAGRSLAWLGKLLPNENNHILFVGYIPTEGGIGIKVKEGQCKTISVSGKRVANKCGITSLNSFSSHMQYPQLVEYYSSMRASKIILVHGDNDAKIEFAKVLQEKISENNMTGKVVCANKGMTINI